MIKNQKSKIRKIKISVLENEEKTLPYVWIDGKENEVSLEVNLIGEGASFKLLGIFLGTGDNSMIFNLSIFHKAKNTKSLTLIRGVFKDRFSFSNDGLINIQKGAKGADGYFVSKILLFDDAKGTSVPSLEIDENDVKASHASTIGRPDKEQLFYLQSRGINKSKAEKLIVSGFFEPVMRMLGSNKESQISNKINKYLPL